MSDFRLMGKVRLWVLPVARPMAWFCDCGQLLAKGWRKDYLQTDL